MFLKGHAIVLINLKKVSFHIQDNISMHKFLKLLLKTDLVKFY